MNRNRSTLTRRTLGMALAAGAVAALAGCGGGDTAAADNDGGLTPLKISVAPIHFETAYLAKEKGYFEEEGLDVTITMGADPASLVAMAVSGEQDIVIGSWINMAMSASEGVPISVIAGNGIVDPEVSNSGVMVRADSGIDSLDDLEGKVIGVQGVKSGGDIPVLQALEAAGVDIKDVTEVAIPYSGMEAALEQNTVDAVVPADSYFHQMEKAGYKSIASPVRDYQASMPVTVWSATDIWVAENGDTAEKFIAAMEKSVAFYSDEANLEEVRAITAEVNNKELDEVGTSYVPASVPINVAEAQAGIDAIEHFELVSDPVSVEELLWDGAPRRDSAAAGK